MITKSFGKPWNQAFLINATNTIILTEGDVITNNEKHIADTFNNYSVGITKTLKLKKYPNGQSLFTDYFKNNESVIKIKE